MRFHDLRHTCAMLLLSRGVNIKVVSEMLGHADIAITLRAYGHVLPHMQDIAAREMDDIFAAGRKLASDGGDDGVKEDVWRVLTATEGQRTICEALYYRTVDPPNKDEEHWMHDAAGARRP
jgi:hypothetical protein